MAIKSDAENDPGAEVSVSDEEATPGGEQPEKVDVPITLDELKKSFVDAGNQLRSAGVEPFREMVGEYLGRGLGGIKGFLTGIEENNKK